MTGIVYTYGGLSNHQIRTTSTIFYLDAPGSLTDRKERKLKKTIQWALATTVGFLLLFTLSSTIIACSNSQSSAINNNSSNTEGNSNTTDNSNSNTETRDFTVSENTPPKLIVNNDVGSVNVQPANNSDSIHVKVTKSGGNSSDIQTNYNQDGNTVTITIKRTNANSTTKADADITVPAKSDLQLQNGTGDITVTGITGQMSLINGTGSIDATQVTLTSDSHLQASTGSVSFNGSIGSGNYQFQSNTGNVAVSLPSNASFHVNANTDVGSITSDFSEVMTQQNVAGASASGSVGNAPSATITLTTNTGSIEIQKH
jgi:hypothetical protein